MDELLQQLTVARSFAAELSITTILTYLFAGLFFAHQLLYHYNFASHSLQDIAWAVLLQIVPDRFLLDTEQQQQLGSGRYATKAEALRNMLGVGRQAVMQQVPGAAGIARRLSMANPTKSDAPAGLGNWDNSCYQNSVLQGLTSLTSLDTFLHKWASNPKLSTQSTLHALQETTTKLRDPLNNGRHLWTPAKLKSMSSWQQQDAQEYFSKIMDELDKDMSKAGGPRILDGLESAGKPKQVSKSNQAHSMQHNPLEGLLSQQVACTACGFSEGLSMIPFNCLTVPLGDQPSFDLGDCLDEYTKLEPITDVECTKCTLLKAKQDLSGMLQLPAAVREQVVKRLREVEEALSNDDFSDETLVQKCQISKKARVSSTKTRQALIGRAPQNLVVHINRSVFDELTGMQRKNYAAVQYPAMLDFGRWVLGSQLQSIPGLPREDMWKYVYRLKAIVTHYGRHENGHYIAYRQSRRAADGKLQWWQLSDEDVSLCSEESALNQGGVFMLFYERADDLERTSTPVPATSVIEAIEESAEPVEVAMSEASTTEDDTDFDEPLPAVRAVPQASPVFMRTANIDRANDDHWNLGRFVAAS